jgi:phage/plasmid-associated DNA primase
MDASRQSSRNPETLSKEVYDEMKKTISMFAEVDAVTKNSSKEPDGGEDAKAEKKDKSKRVLDSSERLWTKDKILKECAELYHENFEQTLDEKTHLIGFNNGIFDLNKNQFREGVPKTVSMCTMTHYVRAGDEVLFDEIDDSFARFFPTKT